MSKVGFVQPDSKYRMYLFIVLLCVFGSFQIILHFRLSNQYHLGNEYIIKKAMLDNSDMSFTLSSMKELSDVLVQGLGVSAV